jgi:hypothetical protein
MGGISERRRCKKCGNKSYTDYVAGLEFTTYSCRCGNVFNTVDIKGNLKLARMLSKSPNTFYNLTVLDLLQILEEDAFKKENPMDAYYNAREKERFKEKLSSLPATYRLIYDFIKKVQDEIGLIERKELIEMLRKECNLKSEKVEKIIEELLRTEFLIIPRKGFLLCVY